MMYYTLNRLGEPVPCEDVLEWGRWSRTADRHVGKDEVNGIWISTVFLGIDHGFSEGPPVLWETMIFGSEEATKYDDYQWRYTSRQEAIAGHKKAVAAILGEQRIN